MSRHTFLSSLLLLASASVFGQQFHVLAPSTFVAGKPYPFATEVWSENNVDLFYSSTVSISVSGGEIPNNQITVRKGRAMTTLETDGSSALNVSSAQFGLNPTANLSTVISHEGTSSGNLVFQPESMHRITNDLLIEASDTLTISAGCWVLLDADVNITVVGHLKVLGTLSSPVVFTSNSSNSWGGILFTLGTGSINYCLINHGGGDDSQWFGHSDSQPVIRSNGGEVTMNQTFIFDCEGKALGAMNGRVRFSNGGISRCDTGGEFGGSYVTVHGSHIMEIPDADGLLEDDDNDGFYFFGNNATDEPNLVDSCVFLIGEDDGIDHNGAILEVRNCWVENFANEGIATSNGNSADVYNSLFKNCEQGIEAGYGSPTVTVDHCVMVDCDYGLRFGDWYDWGCSGIITCTNSIMVSNTDNIHNFDVLTNGPISGAITVTYSISSDAEYDAATGNILGPPVFTPQYQLEPGSPGESAGSDGLNMGLINPTITGIDNPKKPTGKFLETAVYTLQGQLIFSSTKQIENQQLAQHLANGIYLISEFFEHGSYTRKLAVQK